MPIGLPGSSSGIQPAVPWPTRSWLSSRAEAGKPRGRKSARPSSGTIPAAGSPRRVACLRAGGRSGRSRSIPAADRPTAGISLGEKGEKGIKSGSVSRLFPFFPVGSEELKVMERPLNVGDVLEAKIRILPPTNTNGEPIPPTIRVRRGFKALLRQWGLRVHEVRVVQRRDNPTTVPERVRR